MERMPLGQPPSEKGTTMETKVKRLNDVMAQINEIVNTGLADRCEARLEALVEEAEKLKEQLGK